LPTIEWLTVEQVLFIHKRLVDETGGSHGLRDMNLLLAALERPQSSAFGEDAYQTIHAQAAALFHSLAMKHAFVDGNKRVAAAATGLFLRRDGWRLIASHDALAGFALSVARGEVKQDGIAIWLLQQSEPTHPRPS